MAMHKFLVEIRADLPEFGFGGPNIRVVDSPAEQAKFGQALVSVIEDHITQDGKDAIAELVSVETL